MVAFLSAVISGASGSYVLALDGDVDFVTGMTIRPQQAIMIMVDESHAENKTRRVQEWESYTRKN
eukprot:SAG11_NODE_12565_length_697_cov_0.712375_1_plen_65_part_00